MRVLTGSESRVQSAPQSAEARTQNESVGGLDATIKAYLALKLAGVPVTDPRMLKAREVALHFGGVPRMNTFSKLYLALIGLFPWEYVPAIPCDFVLIGKWFHVNLWEMSNWSRSMIVPLAIINHFKPTRP